MKNDALLSGPQRMRLSVLAAGIEDTVAEIEHLLAPHPNQTLTLFADDLPPSSAERLRPLLESIRLQRAQRSANDRHSAAPWNCSGP
jgi:hypothetical protein